MYNVNRCVTLKVRIRGESHLRSKAKRFFISLLILIPGSMFNIFFSTALHSILLKQTSMFTMVPIKQCISSIVTQRQHTVLFLCLEGFLFLLSILYFTINNKPYQSQLKAITPQIKTPIPVGQKQHGSAEWLHERKKTKCLILLKSNSVMVILRI